MQYFIPVATDAEIRKEKARARELRASSWWKEKRASGKCHFCGKAVAPEELTMEHIVPLVRGGKSVKSNLVPACKDCNNRKKHMLPMEWDEYMKGSRDPEEDL